MTQFSKERAELNFRVYIQPQGNAEATLFLSRIAPSVKTNVDTHSSSLTNFKVEPIQYPKVVIQASSSGALIRTLNWAWRK